MQDYIIPPRLRSAIHDFMKMESTGGVLLLIASIFAMILANSPMEGVYNLILDTKVTIKIGDFGISKPMFLWINDGLMAIFFFLIGLEIKREFLEGELSSISQVILPGVGALGGMIVPAGIYAYLNWDNPVAIHGWAIPVATDIAFALALLGTFGARVPTALKVFLLTLAIFDDLAAIIIIAIFYSGELSFFALMIGGSALLSAIILNRLGVMRTSAYIFLGIILWVFVLKSGIHATLAGVLIAFCIPMRNPEGDSPLRRLEHNLHGPVAFAILPIFAFANAGLVFWNMSPADIVHPVTLGIISGLFIGKPVGVMLFVGAAVGLKLVRLPKGTTWAQLLGVACVCGIGFTMSLFITGLAFDLEGGDPFSGDRLGILMGSFLSALLAYIILHFSLPKAHLSNDEGEGYEPST